MKNSIDFSLCLLFCVRISFFQHVTPEGQHLEGVETHVESPDLNLNLTEEGGARDDSNLTYYNNLLNETWLDLVGVMDFFTQRKYDNSSAVQALTAAYRYTHKQQTKVRNPPALFKKIFIAIEGLDSEKRNMLAGRVAQYISGHVVPNPPNTFEVVLKHLPDNSTRLINSYYILNTYIVALHVRYVLQTSAAVVPGYWLGRSAMTIASHFVDKPPPYTSKFWVWPKDLVKPDVIFYITDRQFIEQYEDRSLVRRYLHVLDNWVDPKCVALANCESVDSMMEEMDPYLQELFSNPYI